MLGAADGEALGLAVGSSVSPGSVGFAVCGAGVGCPLGEAEGVAVGF